MKCALLISGQPRNVYECFNNIQQNLLFPNNPDIFVHTWIDPDMVGKTYKANWVKKEAVLVQKDDPDKPRYDDTASNPIPRNVDKIIYNLYQPKKWLFQKPFEFPFNKEIVLEGRPESFLSPQDMFSFQYSFYAANLMKQLYEVEHSMTYDVVMRTRFDNIFQKPITLKDYISHDTIYTPNDYFNDIGISDRWAICNSKLMNTYTQSYLFLEELLEDKSLFLQNEMILGTWVQLKNKIKIQRVDTPYYVRRF